MKLRINILFYVVSSLITIQTLAQDTLTHKSVFPTGIALSYGQGSYSVKDEYISKEKYTGSIPYYSIEWVRFHNQNGYRLQFEYWKSTNISNNNVSAEVQQFNFNQDFIYPIGRFSFLAHPVYAYLGPSVQVFYYEIYYHFVAPGTFITPTTFGTIGSLGINTEFLYPIGNKFAMEGLLRSNLVSFTSKNIDEQRFPHEKSPALLSVVSATKIDCDLLMRYYPIKRLSLSLGYKFELSRINNWDNYVGASSNVVFTVNIKI